MCVCVCVCVCHGVYDGDKFLSLREVRHGRPPPADFGTIKPIRQVIIDQSDTHFKKSTQDFFLHRMRHYRPEPLISTFK